MSAVWRLLDPNLVERLNHLHMASRRLTAGSTIGSHRSPLKGVSIEFRQHRFYVPGDEPRRLDWRVFARTDRPYIKEYDEQTNLRCLLLVDVSGSMRYAGAMRQSKMEVGCRAAAALGYVLLQAGESVGAALCDDNLRRWLPPGRGPGQLSRLIDLLERSNASRRAWNPEHACAVAADRMESRGIIVLITDAYVEVERLRTAFARLSHDRHEIVLIRVIDPDELDIPWHGWVRFRGMEQEGATLLDASLLRQHYLKRRREHDEALAGLCRQLALTQLVVRADRDLLRQLSPLLQRGRA